MKTNIDRKNLQKIIRKKFLQEFMAGGTGWDSNNDITLFHGYASGTQKFPYGNIDTPENIKMVDSEKKMVNKTNYNNVAKNNDVYEFPFDEFKLGVEVETQEELERKGELSIFDIANKVIRKLSEDPQFYSKNSGDENNIKDNK